MAFLGSLVRRVVRICLLAVAVIAIAIFPLLLLLALRGTLRDLRLILRILLLILWVVSLTQALQWGHLVRFHWLWLLDHRSVISLGHRLAIYQLPQGDLPVSTRRQEPADMGTSGAEHFLGELELEQRVDHISMVLEHGRPHLGLNVVNLDV